MGEFDEDGLEWTDSYQKVKVTYESKVLNGTVRQRGGISYCNSFPQLKLKLGKDQTIEGQKEFKIITHGFHDLDPQVPIDAPSCGGELYGERAFLQTNAFENILYDISALLLDVHLKNQKFQVRYLDGEIQIDVTQKAYFIEDRKAAAKRYNFKSMELTGPEWDASWRIDETDEMIESVASDLYRAKLKKELEDYKRARPGASAKEVASAMNAFKIPSQKEIEEFTARAPALRDEFVKKRKEAQVELLKQIDPASLAHTILFELMIANSDWNILRTNNHSDPIKNLELFQNASGKSYFIAPYDFDESHMNGLTSQVYKSQFEIFRKQLPAELVSVVLPSIKLHGPEYLKRLELLPDSYPLTPNLRETLAAYAVALREILAEL